jgi:hypothetical protein
VLADHGFRTVTASGNSQAGPPSQAPGDARFSAEFTFITPLTSRQQLIKALVPEPSHLLTDEERACLQAGGAYTLTCAHIKLTLKVHDVAQLHRHEPLPADGASADVLTASRPAPFERIVVIFPYDEDATLYRICDAVQVCRALPGTSARQRCIQWYPPVLPSLYHPCRL